ncbi:unnamed protein product [Phaedon cochleariae]|uniref:Uncharacterized protein n=1 Tax=Phaedon cochleariae TaxID=80249 RepID=A0A9P0DM33_PHACE|nr:unnamed protein product [Phaedon cochleariae]
MIIFCRFLWFNCVAIGAVATSVIIFSLWDKFQTNPTITGLDTDFHNWEVPFPAITLCQEEPTSNQKIEEYIQKQSVRNGSDDNQIEFFKDLTKLSYDSWARFTTKYSTQGYIDFNTNLKDLVFNLTYKCEETFESCTWKSYPYNCCEGFFPVFTENGFCYTFNSRHYERKIPGTESELPDFGMHYIQETDMKWSLKFKVKSMDSYFPIYILNSEEVAGIDTQAQHVWDFSMESMMFSVKQTYTTQDTAQLSIKQRRCAFPNEIKLKVNKIYSYTACTRECRMKNAMKLCSCVPFFYPVAGTSYRHCGIDELPCITSHLEKIKSIDECSCYLGCSNTVYEIEKLNGMGSSQEGEEGALECQFVSWPMVRYKREVLFGWVDLLVSFGGIAGLFLGFSLLSGVEILYYFTIRACCMVVKERNDLRKMRFVERSRQSTKKKHDVQRFVSKLAPMKASKYATDMNFALQGISNKITPSGKEGYRLRRPADIIKSPYGIEFLN